MTEAVVDVIEDIVPAEACWDDLSDAELEARISKEPGSSSTPSFC